jgi:5-oxopent-3-ene-1,2,5-tricarboxylate decarboxylase/2-hydroxyhepta-2,4-diene-1,7-dioate isomerase
MYRDGALYDGEGGRHELPEVRLLPPIRPPKVVGVALNYRDHAEELGLEVPKDPALFFKPLTSLVGSGEAIVYPQGARYMHYEAELAVVLRGPARRVAREEAHRYVKGYTILNDVTVRDFVGNFYRPPVKAKGWDTFGPVGPWVVESLPDPDATELRTYVNGELRQQGNTREFIFTVAELIGYISEFMTLEEDDLLLTGTPKGISPIHAGDTVRIEIDGVGALENPVVAEPASPRRAQGPE